MGAYRVELQIWPYSGVKREPASYQADYERALRGVERPVMIIEADSVKAATEKVEAIRLGVQLDERVWRCRIYSIAQVKEGERTTELMLECAGE